MARYLDMTIVVEVGNAQRDGNETRWVDPSVRELVCVGGRWDRRRRRYLSAPPTAGTEIVLRFHQGQREAATWIADWLRRWAADDWAGVDRDWSLMLYGARACGKTHLAVALLVLFAVLAPRSIIWAISATTETGDELKQALESLMPRRWYRRWLAKTGRSATYKLANGSRILLKSGVKAQRLKAGRVDMVLINEAQDQKPLVYVKVRPRVADVAGLVILTANPPDVVEGTWVDEHFDKAKAGEIDGVAFQLDPDQNPFINHASFISAAKEFDTATADRELRGLRAPPGDVVMFEWRDAIHWRDPDPSLVDITAEVLRKELGRALPRLVGADFQRSPHMSARGLRIYRDPASGQPLIWVVDEADVKGDEFSLIDELEHRDYAPDLVAVVMDASGWTQDGAHNHGKTSERAFRARSWNHLYKPQKTSDANPAIAERMKSANALLKQQRLFVARRCAATAEAFRRYENHNGRPSRRSHYAHAIDAVTYVTYRLCGVPVLPRQPTKYVPVRRFKRASEMAMEPGGRFGRSFLEREAAALFGRGNR